MPRVIFKCPHVKGGTARAAAHLGNAVGYIATREGVQRIDPGKMDFPATEKQVNMVEKLVREFPQSRGLEEYVDYKGSPTRDNASEFITRAVEDNLDQIAKMENYVDYIAKRPRAQRFGSHGLFTSGDEPLTLPPQTAVHPQGGGGRFRPCKTALRKRGVICGWEQEISQRRVLHLCCIQ